MTKFYFYLINYVATVLVRCEFKVKWFTFEYIHVIILSVNNGKYYFAFRDMAIEKL